MIAAQPGLPAFTNSFHIDATMITAMARPISMAVMPKPAAAALDGALSVLPWNMNAMKFIMQLSSSEGSTVRWFARARNPSILLEIDAAGEIELHSFRFEQHPLQLVRVAV